MTLIHRLVSGARWLMHRRVAEQELDDELRSFVEMATADKVREGVPPAEARRQAILALGGVEQPGNVFGRRDPAFCWTTSRETSGMRAGCLRGIAASARWSS